MNTAIATGRGSSVGEEGQFAGIALAIPMRMIELVVDQIISRGEVTKGFLGIEMSSLEALSMRSVSDPLRNVVRHFRGVGVPITNVPDGNPAAKAGILPGDVLLSINEVAVPQTDVVAAEIGFQPPGSTVQLGIWRWNSQLQEPQRLSIPVVLDALDPRSLYENQVFYLRQQGIFELVTLTPVFAEALGIDWQPGVYVVEAEPRGLITRGSIITEVAGESVSSVEDLYYRLKQAAVPPSFQRFPGAASSIGLEVVDPDGTAEIRFLPL